MGSNLTVSIEAKPLKLTRNVTVGKAYFDLLGQVTYNTVDGADWSKGAIMFDFPSYRPTVGDQKRFNEPFCRFNVGLCVFRGEADCWVKTTKLPTRSSTSSRAARTGPRIPATCLPGLSRTWIRM